MGFKLKTDDKVWWPVTINVPVDGGKIEKVKCHAQFDLLDADEYDALKTKSDIEFLCRVVTGFEKDIMDAEGVPIPYSDENKLKLFKSKGYVRLGFIGAYHDAVSGYLSKN